MEKAWRPPSCSRQRDCQLLVLIWRARLYRNQIKWLLNSRLDGILKLIDWRSLRASAKIFSGTLTHTRFLIMAKIVSLAMGDASTNNFSKVWIWYGVATLFSISSGYGDYWAAEVKIMIIFKQSASWSFSVSDLQVFMSIRLAWRCWMEKGISTSGVSSLIFSLKADQSSAGSGFSISLRIS